jgi:hypothetical protein
LLGITGWESARGHGFIDRTFVDADEALAELIGGVPDTLGKRSRTGAMVGVLHLQLASIGPKRRIQPFDRRNALEIDPLAGPTHCVEGPNQLLLTADNIVRR